MDDEKTTKEKEIYFNQFVCPLVVAIANLVFALFCAVRVVMQRSYQATDTFKNELIVDAAQKMTRNSLQEDMQKYKGVLNKARMTSEDLDVTDVKQVESMKDRYGARTEKSKQSLSFIVKITGCVFMVLIGMLYVATQLLYADSTIASMVMGLMGAFFLMFVAFVYVAFRRIVESMGKWLADLPMWNCVGTIMRSDWMIAFLLVTVGIWTPLVLALSALNQCVRKCRGIAGQAKLRSSKLQDGSEKEYPSPLSLSITPRVYRILSKMMAADKLSVLGKSYIFNLLMFSYTVVPLLLNVVLSWTIQQLSTWNYGVILMMTFLIGIVAFLLPPVPGMTVYIFGGLIVSDDKICPAGFFWGCVINIGLCWFLKLAACAVQQKCIGGSLGQSTWVRQTVGVHKVTIRCIEAEMQKPGMSFGKVAILCGGPDWPVSVLAGVLGLSLLQCEIGTIPIIFFVAPCALTGSFYVKKTGENDVWTRLANMMIVTSVVVNLLLWALAAWAIQNQLESNYDELTRPLPQNVHLEWLDHKAEEIEKRCRVTWSDVPMPIRSLFALGAFAQTMVSQAFWYGLNYLFGSFQVSDHIDTLEWYGGDDGLFTLLGLVSIAAYFFGWICHRFYPCWRTAKFAPVRKQAAKELAGQEASWKEEWLKDAKEKELAAEGKSAEPAAEVGAASDDKETDVGYTWI